MFTSFSKLPRRLQASDANAFTWYSVSSPLTISLTFLTTSWQNWQVWLLLTETWADSSTFNPVLQAEISSQNVFGF